MSQNTKIEWADHTFNPWIGCTRVGPGCDHCYAEADFDKRRHRVMWGAGQPRSLTKTWGDPARWNKQADAFFAAHGRRQRVFCASLADVFDNEVDPQWRYDLWELIWSTPNLDWLLLTKRIGNVNSMLPEEWGNGMIDHWPHVWIGATIVNQAEADRDIPKLLAVPAAKRFLSMEPLLGPVNIEKWLEPWTCSNCGHHGSFSDSGPCQCDHCGVLTVYDKSDGTDECPVYKKTDQDEGVGETCPNCQKASNWDRDYGFKFDSQKPLLDWVIVGGESGANARPMHPAWVRSLRDQCQAAGVPFLFKQWGEWWEYVNEDHYTHCGAEKHAHAWVDADTGDSGKCWIVDDDGSWSNWTGTPRGLPKGDEDVNGGNMHPSVTVMGRHGKKAAGRLLDGREWNEVPS